MTHRPLTTTQMARLIGIGATTLLARAKRLGITPAVDTGHVKLWHYADIERFGPPRAAGRPRVRR